MVAGVLFFVKTIFGLVLARAQFSFLARIETLFSEQIARTVLAGDISEVKRYSRADLEWAILRSTDIAFSRILGRALVLLAEFGLAFLIFGLFVFTDWASALIILLYFSIVLALLQMFAHRRSRIGGSHVVDGSVSVGQAIADSIVAFKEISVLSRLDFFIERIRGARSRVALGTASYNYLQAIPRLIMELAMILGAIGFVVYLAFRNEGTPDFGLLSVFVIGSLRMMSALLPLQRAFMELRYYAPQALGAQQMIRESLSAESVNPESAVQAPAYSSSGAAPADAPAAVEILSVSFAYNDHSQPSQVIRNVSWRIEPGQRVAIIGPSGAGKSTLVDILLGLHEPSEGKIFCFGVPPREYRKANPGAIGYVPQKPGLVSGTFRENIALGIPPDEVDSECLEMALRRAEIFDFVKSLPLGIDSPLGNHLDSLSGGQIQRIGLARALYTKPQLLVLDEATSALDAKTESTVTASIQNLESETTVIIVAHRLSTIQNADTVIVMDGGSIVGKGSLRDLQKSSSLVKEYVALMRID